MPRMSDHPVPPFAPASHGLPARSSIRAGTKWDEKMAQLREAGLALDYAAGQLVSCYQPSTTIDARIAVAFGAPRLGARAPARRRGGRQEPSRGT
jgi:hypothetical protein